MNWDISIGQCKQLYGRLLQVVGRRLDRRSVVLNGERIEFSGRLQTRYGALKHEAQWGSALLRLQRQPASRTPGERAVSRVVTGSRRLF